MGSRRYGGAVGYGGNYEVAEGGKTELYIPNRGNPMLMGSKGGQVVSNSDLMNAMSGGAPNINIQVLPAAGYTATVSGDGVTQPMVIQMIQQHAPQAISSDLRSGGVTLDAVTTVTTAQKTIL